MRAAETLGEIRAQTTDPKSVRQDSSATGRLHSRFGDLPLSWKLLLPSLVLIVMLGATGGFLVVRDLAVRSQAAVDLQLSQRAFEARSLVRDHEASLIESANFAANLDGIVPAIRRNDATDAARLLQSVVALKPDLEVLAATDVGGTVLARFMRTAPGEVPALDQGGSLAGQAILTKVLSDSAGGKIAGFVEVEGRDLLAIAAPVCTQADSCSPIGAVVVGVGVDRVASEILTRLGPKTAISFFDASGQPVASAGDAAPRELPAPGVDGPVRINEESGSVRVATLYAPIEIRGHPLGTLAVSTSIAEASSAVRRAGFGLGLILLAAIAGIAAIGILLSQLVLRQVRSLAEANRALGRGDLSARADVTWNDEIGELASRFNEMAEQLEAMYETLELRVAQRTEEVERLLKERTEFFASVSHELRTPLAVILRHAEMLLDDGYIKNGRWRSDMSSALRASGSQLLHLIDDILELAKDQAGGLDVDVQEMDLGAFFEDTRRILEPLARSAGVKAAVRVPKGLPMVLTDPQRLRQIVLNLVDNAVKYTPAGGKVEITARLGDRFIEVLVSDTGVGLPSDCGNQIFRPFFRVKGINPQHGQSSSGLGLAVVKRLVEAQGGHIEYTSSQGVGTTFAFTIPLADSARPHLPVVVGRE